MKSLLFVISSFFILTGCGYHEETITTTQKSYIYFSGNTKKIEVSIDNGDKFAIKTDNEKRYRYDLEPGKHLIHAYRNGIVVLKREIYIGDGISKEIEVK